MNVTWRGKKKRQRGELWDFLVASWLVGDAHCVPKSMAPQSCVPAGCTLGSITLPDAVNQTR